MMRCPKCGFESQNNFCPVCGTPLQPNPYQPPAPPVPQQPLNQPAPPLPKKSPVGWIIAASVIGSVVVIGIVIAILSATLFRSSVFDSDNENVKPTVGYQYDDDDDVVTDSAMLLKGEPLESDYGTITLQSVTYGADSALGNDGSFLRCNIEIKNNTNRELTHQYMDTTCSNTKYFCEDYYYSLNGEKREDVYGKVTLKPGESAVLTLLLHCPDGKLPSNDLIVTTTLGKYNSEDTIELIMMISPKDIQQDAPATTPATTAAPER